MLLIVDSNYVGWSSAHALSRGSLEYKGSPTSVIYGFLNQLLTLLETFEPDQIVFCWDADNYKRKAIFPDYKKKEPATEEEQEMKTMVYTQFVELRNVILPYLGFSNVFRVEGYEADDLIANLVIKGNCNPEQTIVVSRDHDLYQLLDYCSLYSSAAGKTTNKELFIRHYQIAPSQWAEVKAMKGCSSDKIPGVGGVGDKKAVEFLLGTLNKGKIFLKIINSQEIIERNRQLVQLPYPGTPYPKIKKNDLSIATFKHVCQEYGLESFLKKENLKKYEKGVSRID